jgi:hypothetical protein
MKIKTIIRYSKHCDYFEYEVGETWQGLFLVLYNSVKWKKSELKKDQFVTKWMEHLVWESERQLERPRRRWEENNKKDFR